MCFLNLFSYFCGGNNIEKYANKTSYTYFE